MLVESIMWGSDLETGRWSALLVCHSTNTGMKETHQLEKNTEKRAISSIQALRKVQRGASLLAGSGFFIYRRTQRRDFSDLRNN